MASEAIASWNHMVDDFHYSTEEFYKLLEAQIKKKEVPGVKTRTRNIKQGGMLSKNRLYFEVSRKEYIFHVCAAPFGKGYFFSWYLRVKTSWFRNLLTRLPVLGPAFKLRFELQPYYKIDTANMFKASIHSCITDTIDEVLQPKGSKLSELERRIDS